MKPSCWPDWLDALWAKSSVTRGQAGESLAQHTWLVLERLAELMRLRPDLASYLNSSRLWHCLFWACFLHDLGKAASGFQLALRGKKPWKRRHEVLSLAFLDWIAASFSPNPLPVFPRNAVYLAGSVLNAPMLHDLPLWSDHAASQAL